MEIFMEIFVEKKYSGPSLLESLMRYGTCLKTKLIQTKTGSHAE